LKHGPNALVSQATPLLMIATVDHSDPNSVRRYQKTLSLMRDMHKQGAEILAIANFGDHEVAATASYSIFVEEASDFVQAICEIVPLQLFAYFMAINKGIDVDNPRNLEKAVLAE
jgi:glucosamine--fructose-6-phosphate aminotransferase (isomerizing)